jgi:hypothetical protein
MYHRLQFQAAYCLDLRVSGKARLEQLLIQEGEVIDAQVRPYVQETDEGPVEVADLYLPGDGALLAVPMGHFQFV